MEAANDYIAELSLRAARIGDNKAPDNHPMDALFTEGLAILKRDKPAKEPAARVQMKAPLAIYRTNVLYKRFATANLDAPGGMAAVVAARNAFHHTAMAPLRTGYVHIAAPISPHAAPPNILAPQAEYQRLRFFLNEVRCIDETGSGWFGEMGSDETYLTYAGVDENGQSESGQIFKVRNFDDNTTRVFSPPALLANFNIHEGGNTFPKVYSSVINLMEHDFGSIAEWFKKVANAVKGEVQKYLAAALGVAIGSFLGPLGAAIGAAVGYVLNWLIGIIGSWLGDDNIGTKTIQCTVNSYTGKLQNGLASMTGSFDLTGSQSRYRVFYTWSLA